MSKFFSINCKGYRISIEKNIKEKNFDKYLKIICNSIKKHHNKSGYYNFALKDKNFLKGFIITKFVKSNNFKEIFILKMLEKNKQLKNINYLVELFDAYKEIFNVKLEVNESKIVDKEYSLMLCQEWDNEGEVIGEFDESFFIIEIDINSIQ